MLIFRKICGNPMLANTAWSFAGTNFFIAGHCEVEFFELNIQISPRKEFLRENILTCFSGAQMGWINEFKKC